MEKLGGFLLVATILFWAKARIMKDACWRESSSARGLNAERIVIAREKTEMRVDSQNNTLRRVKTSFEKSDSGFCVSVNNRW